MKSQMETNPMSKSNKFYCLPVCLYWKFNSHSKLCLGSF